MACQAARSDRAWLDFLVLLSRLCGSKRTEEEKVVVDSITYQPRKSLPDSMWYTRSIHEIHRWNTSGTHAAQVDPQ